MPGALELSADTSSLGISPNSPGVSSSLDWAPPPAEVRRPAASGDPGPTLSYPFLSGLRHPSPGAAAAVGGAPESLCPPLAWIHSRSATRFRSRAAPTAVSRLGGLSLPRGHLWSPDAARGARRAGKGGPHPNGDLVPASPSLSRRPCGSRAGTAPGTRRPARSQQQQRLQAARELGAVVAGDLGGRTNSRGSSKLRGPPPPARPTPRPRPPCCSVRAVGDVAA